MTSEMTGTICRFFFLTLLDEEATFGASARALQLWRSKLGRSAAPGVEAEPILVAILSKQSELLRRQNLGGQPLVFSKEDWELPQGLDLGSWLEFRREASQDEFFAVLLVKVLGFSASGVAHGLKVSEGTVSHRLSRGLRRLGAIHGTPGSRRP